MTGWVRRYALSLVCLGVATGAGAQDSPSLRLKARTFVPPANVHAGAAQAPSAQAMRAGGRRHLLVQFGRPITAEDRTALARAGAVPLRYVPDRALAVSAGAAFDASSIPGVRWVGALDASDRISAETAADLARTTPEYPLTVIEFQPDVTRAESDRALLAARAARVETPYLPAYMALVRTDRSAIQALSRDDLVAWIYPGAPELANSAMLACEGTVTADGIVASYSTVGEGWDGEGRHSAALSFFLQYPSIDVSADAQRGEIQRAMAEWSRYVDVRWIPAAGAGESRSVNILWGPTEHGDGYPFSADTLAHTFYPAPWAPESIAGDMHFNENYLWGVRDETRYDIFSVALHELGHALGLAHSSNPGAVMYPMYRGLVSGLSSEDIQGVRSLYADAPQSMLPQGWNDQSIGSDMSGAGVAIDGRYTIDAAGTDVWGTSDQFRFVSTTLSGDGDIVAHLDSLEAVHRWTKAGVMIRASNAAGAAHAFMLVSGSKGLAFQRRLVADGQSYSTDGIAGAAPQWVWLSRRGTRVEAYAAADGQAWTFIGADTIALGSTALAGLAVTSHDAAAVATAVFSNVSVTRARVWNGTDIGVVGRAGSWAPTSLGGAVTGAGDDIWNSADAFQFAWTPMHGDTEILARVTSLENVRAWTKAGVMIRQSLAPGSPHAFMLVSAGKGYAFQRRRQADGWSEHTAGGSGAAPGWVRLVRQGDTFTAYRSNDGSNWTVVGVDTIPMGEDVLVGLAVSSHTTTATARAVFDRVTVR
jgi:regulation of enolase protein 1 (concanavalin A-like superfamily)